MTETLLSLSGLMLTLVVSVGVVGYMNAPLRKLLRELCGDPQRSDFWVVFSNVTVVLLPVIFAIPSEPVAHPGAISLLEVCEQLKWGMVGLVVSVLMLGWILGRFIPKSSMRP
jgi:hypothetical protein